MPCNVELNSPEYSITFDYSVRDRDRILIWIQIKDKENNSVTLFFRNPKHVADFITALINIIPSEKYADLIAEGAK
jgi:hypothetical protein